MHTDARTLPNGTLLEGDLCIVGAGAAGLSIALEWIDAGKKVILLEGGGLEYEARTQDLYRGEIVGLPYYPLQAARRHHFGGTTGHWAGFCSTYDPSDFEKRPWVPHSGWPITRASLDPFYARAQPVLELGVGWNPELDAIDNVLLIGSVMGLTLKDIHGQQPVLQIAWGRSPRRAS